MTRINGPHTREKNELTLYKLDEPQRRVDKKRATYAVAYVWRNVSGGVQGDELILLTDAEAKPMLKADSLFDHLNLF